MLCTWRGGVAALLALALAQPVRPCPQAPRAEEVGPAGDGDGGELVGARSYLTSPLFLEGVPPECRSLRSIQVGFAEAKDPLPGVERDRAEARALAEEVVRRLREGVPFEDLFAVFADAPPQASGGVLGTYAPGVLLDDLGEFLWSAQIGEVSEPIEAKDSFHVVQRIRRWAGCRQIQIQGTTRVERALADEVARRLRAGESFEDVLAELDPEKVRMIVSAFERGVRDRFLKAAIFRSGEGEIVGPLRSPLGFHVAERIPIEEVPRERWETTWVRARAIVVAHSEAPGPVQLSDRSPIAARDLAFAIHDRILAGEDMASVAREVNDDVDGKRRGGDLGWLHRPNPGTSSVLDRLFTVEPGELIEPLPVGIGWIVLRREG